MVGGNNHQFSKTICSICYEDLKPIVEDLQSISICGHVFHELCLQQWFEYCTNGKKRNCPVCKQTCSTSNVGRLYFQSIGGPNDANLSQKLHDCEESPDELRSEVKRFKEKVLGLSTALEQRHKDLEAVNNELTLCKEKLDVETKLKIKALNEKAMIQQLLHIKSEDLDTSTQKCMSLQERNMALAKELAALKLVSDINLDEDEVMKLASLGNEAHSKETFDILKKSLVIRNKSYKELITKCNTLGRGEARSQCKLDKAKEKIRKLKAKVLELECAMEAKDNEVLRNLKASRNMAGNVTLQNDYRSESQMNKFSAKDKEVSSAVPLKDANQVDMASSLMRDKMRPLNDSFHKDTSSDVIASNLDQNNGENNIILLDEDEDELKTSSHANEFSTRCPTPKINSGAVFQGCNLSNRSAPLDVESDDQVHELKSRKRVLGSINLKSSMELSAASQQDLMIDDMPPDQSLFSIRKETPSAVLVAHPGDSCFTGGLRGPDGTSWHLGKWCKKVNGENSSTVGSQGSSAKVADLIAIGADGRGGRIKVLRSLNSSSTDNNDASVFPKRCKNGIKASNSQPQIERFFGRAGH